MTTLTTTLPLRELAKSIADTIRQVELTDIRITLTRHGKPVAAIVPIADADRLDASENAFIQSELDHKDQKTVLNKTESKDFFAEMLAD